MRISLEAAVAALQELRHRYELFHGKNPDRGHDEMNRLIDVALSTSPPTSRGVYNAIDELESLRLGHGSTTLRAKLLALAEILTELEKAAEEALLNQDPTDVRNFT